MKEQQRQGLEFVQTLIQKSWESPEFKDQLVKTPLLTIESITGQKIQNGKKIIVEDQTNDAVIYLNIPAEPNFNELELTEEQLEMIAGGITPSVVVVGYVGGFLLGAAATYFGAKYLF